MLAVAVEEGVILAWEWLLCSAAADDDEEGDCLLGDISIPPSITELNRLPNPADCECCDSCSTALLVAVNVVLVAKLTAASSAWIGVTYNAAHQPNINTNPTQIT